jgi:RND family efflux transporter MFP subunit
MFRKINDFGTTFQRHGGNHKGCPLERFVGATLVVALFEINYLTNYIKQKRPTMIYYLRFLLALSLLALLTACEPTEETQVTSSPPPRLPEVTTMTLQPQAWTMQIQSYGIVEPVEEVDIAIDFSATVNKVHFKEGQKVKAGKTLLEFDARERALQLKQAENVVKDAKAQLEQANDVYQRRRQLHKKRAISVESYRQSKTAFDSAKAQLQRALASLNLARHELKETLLRSPVSGAISKREVEVGETVLPGQILATLQTIDTVRVVTYVTEKDVNTLHLGAEVQIVVTGVRGKTYTGRIESIGIKADARTGNFTVKINVPNPKGLLRDGMSARVTMAGHKYSKALLIPRDLLVDRKRQRLIYKLVEGKAVAVEPVFAATMGEVLLVLEGLEAGDVLISSGLDNVVHGSTVKILPKES